MKSTKFFSLILMASVLSSAAIVLTGVLTSAQEAVVNVVLHPGGSFKAKTTDVKGSAVQKGTEFTASQIVVKLENLQTGVSLRDTHTKKHLDVEHFPEAILTEGKGKDGTGEGTIKIKGIEQKIKGTYEISGEKLIAHFPLKLSEFKIDGIKYMGIGVDDQVTLDVTLPITKDAPAKETVKK